MNEEPLTVATVLHILKLLVLGGLVGIGAATVIGWLPTPLDAITVFAVLAGATVWATRQIIWSRRTLRELQARIHELGDDS